MHSHSPFHRLTQCARRGAVWLCAGALLFCAPAVAQTGTVQRVLDELERALNGLGNKAEELLGPGLGLGEKLPAAYTATRQFEDRYPVGPQPTLSISNEFGTISVSTWAERVVQVHAEILVGAEKAELAEPLADAIKVNVQPGQELIEIRNQLPEQQQGEKVSISVNYDIKVPAEANVVADNFFGDTSIRGVHGATVVDAQYGGLELTELAGSVQVRMHGEFPLKAFGLQQGGIFQLHGAQAEFGAISGDLSISNVRGSVLLRQPGPQTNTEIQSNGGPVRIMLGADALPDLTATALYGKIDSTLDLSRSNQGGKAVARLAQAQAQQRVLVNATFGDVLIEREGVQGKQEQTAREGTQLFFDSVQLEEPAPEGTFLTVDATVGDIHIEGYDEDVVRVQARRLVWMPNSANVDTAMQALKVEAQRAGGQLTIQTRVTEGFSLLAPGEYRIDLTVQCPRGVPLTVRAEQGTTTIARMAAPVHITQSQEDVMVERCEGEVEIHCMKGSLTVKDCMGAVTTVCRDGSATVTGVAGKINTDTERGNTVIDTPGAEVSAASREGDIRVVALDGLTGDLRVTANQGNIRVLLPENLNAELEATAQDGIIASAKRQLSGTIAGNTYAFSTRTLEGKYLVSLRAQGGDIHIDGEIVQ